MSHGREDSGLRLCSGKSLPGARGWNSGPRPLESKPEGGAGAGPGAGLRGPHQAPIVFLCIEVKPTHAVSCPRTRVTVKMPTSCPDCILNRSSTLCFNRCSPCPTLLTSGPWRHLFQNFLSLESQALQPWVWALPFRVTCVTFVLVGSRFLFMPLFYCMTAPPSPTPYCPVVRLTDIGVSSSCWLCEHCARAALGPVSCEYSTCSLGSDQVQGWPSASAPSGK